ncbi:hypothetical protein [Haliangium ochraceum]|uniref:Cyclase/dehydrase n=1 Tax=Haliangium ochraceum (strain DSM 14365 / JCM 11303 / SMP-2) TaxID=502025 RepID=D0LK55_HALO1|nr:hypothetical protein [Haliangium ochraceum]ACY13089.1 hypothetical protein Hoch_0448 [Haliangium ochraceum DSM 14365]
MARQIDIRDTIRFPRQLVFEMYRENLSELDVYLPNIESIKVEKRTELDEHRVEFVNRWQAARTEVPALLRPFIKPEMLQWLDYATWDERDFSCQWRTELPLFNGAIKSTGVNYYRALGDDEMEIRLTGSIEVDASKIPGVPRLMYGKVATAMENAVLKVTEPNLRAVNQSFARYLTEQRAGSAARAAS